MALSLSTFDDTVAKPEYSICLGATMRDAEVFGADPDEHDPSRWMTRPGLDDIPPGYLENMINVLELNFGSGTSKCLGQKIALLELAVFLSKVSSLQTVIFPPSSRSQVCSHRLQMTEYEWEPAKSPIEFGVIVRRGVLRIGSMPVKVRRRKSIQSRLS